MMSNKQLSTIREELREAFAAKRVNPITALDRSADVTDWYAFVSYDNPNNVTFILNVDPLLESWSVSCVECVKFVLT